MVRGRSRAAREEEVRALLKRWERSGLPLSRFADQTGVATKTLYRWRRRLGVGSELVRRGRPPRSREPRVRGVVGPPSMFTEVGAARSGPSSSAVTLEVVLIDGTTVRVPDHFDPQSLRMLLDTLRGC
jgi:transposase-like protein